ncbi:10700_t:CDS:2 [Funneliformis geosporum]|uniref:10700_t:CDS:1 n=1 Tax=Funneliformis geosporum TaxID=1117311 RepID=A0A9W4SA63_9GLOM|nr:10700_t:CDS:2 [Funneliformis geosporum]
MQELNNRAEKESKEQINKAINQIIKDYKLDFPCPHCDKRINDGHFDQGTRLFGYINEHIRNIVEKHFSFQEGDYRQKWLKEMEENRTYENFPLVKELKKNVGELQQKVSQLQSSEHIEKLERVRQLSEAIKQQREKINELQSSEYIEKLERVRKLAEEVSELRNQNQLLRDQSRINSKKKGELFEQYISEELNRVFDNKDKISKITQTGRKADFLQEVLTENNEIAGRIIYEAKDTEKWDNEWVNKLENDMAHLRADFGIIIATCENGKPLRCLDPRKKIYVSDDTNFIYIAKIMRDSLIQKHNLLETVNADSKEKRIKKKELGDLNKNANSISRVAENIKSEQQNQQTQSAVLQLASSLLGNTNNLNQLTKKPSGEAKTIQEIEEEFLISAFQPSRSGIGGTLPPEIIERICEREEREIGGSSDLIIFLKPKAGRIPQVKGNQNNSETIINFSAQIAYEDKKGYKQFVRDYLTEKGKFDYDAYCLIRTDSSMSGPSAGIAYYLALHSLINQIPLPRNLGSTGTVFKRPKVGGIGGLNLKLGYNVGYDIKKENPINIFILCEENRNKKACAKLNNGRCYKENSGSYYDLVSLQIKEKIKQVHFISQVDQIETALNEILKNPNEKFVHSCGSKPREPPRQPNSEITSEQILTLIAELHIREKGGLGEHQDFWEKLQAAYAKSSDYQEATAKVLRLHEKYLGNSRRVEELEKAKVLKEQELQILLKQGPPPPRDIEEEIKRLHQEYQTKFKEIASPVANLTMEILTNLQKFSYTIQKIT